MNEPTGDSILDLLIQHEEIIGSLYESCRRAFPAAEAFWQTLVQEEKAHAEVLRELGNNLRESHVLFNPRLFNRVGIRTAMDHVGRQKQRVEAGDCTLAQALALALDIERAIIERDMFRVFESDSAAMKREFDSLRTHTLEHMARISRKRDEIKAAPTVA